MFFRHTRARNIPFSLSFFILGSIYCTFIQWIHSKVSFAKDIYHERHNAVEWWMEWINGRTDTYCGYLLSITKKFNVWNGTNDKQRQPENGQMMWLSYFCHWFDDFKTMIQSYLRQIYTFIQIACKLSGCHLISTLFSFKPISNHIKPVMIYCVKLYNCIQMTIIDQQGKHTTISINSIHFHRF